MKLFQHPSDSAPLGTLLREARIARRFSLEQAAHEARISKEEIQALEEDSPLDPRRARIQAVSYARTLGLDPAELHDFLPPLPEVTAYHRKFFMNATRPPKPPRHPTVAMLAPMGKFTLALILMTSLLGTWGLVHQIARVRIIPGLTSNTPSSETSLR